MQQLRRSRQFWLVPISWTWLWWKSQRWQRKFNTGHENGDVFVEKNRYLQPEAIYCKLQYHINWISYQLNIISVKYLASISDIWYWLQMSSEAPFSKNFRVTDEVKQSFDKEGFFILRSLFSKEEVSIISNPKSHPIIRIIVNRI